MGEYEELGYVHLTNMLWLADIESQLGAIEAMTHMLVDVTDPSTPEGRRSRACERGVHDARQELIALESELHIAEGGQ